ncbi:hypothetical protein [Synechococcus sp. M16CYN]|uniref:hypothetical protein n=1 Tax=Synechococcus sp. M16CYN TaxID=3103139 RepID=UPI00334207C1
MRFSVEIRRPYDRLISGFSTCLYVEKIVELSYVKRSFRFRTGGSNDSLCEVSAGLNPRAGSFWIGSGGTGEGHHPLPGYTPQGFPLRSRRDIRGGSLRV